MKPPFDLGWRRIARERRKEAAVALNRRKFWIGISFLPILIFALLRANPQADSLHDAPIFHFYIVTLASFAALVSALVVASAVPEADNPHILFLTMGFAAIAAFFVLHGLATPGVILQGFNQAVGWSARLSLFSGAILFGLASIPWPAKLAKQLVERSHQLWIFAGLLYTSYMVIAFLAPGPLARLSLMEPWINYTLSGLTVGLYLWSAWRAAKLMRHGSHRLWTIISVSLILLAQAQLSMTFGPLWRLSWWLYHVLMLTGFLLSVGAIALEYESVRKFRATRYFTALGSLATLTLALLGGAITSRMLGEPDLRLPLTALSLTVSTGLFLISFLIVWRADKMIEQRTEALKEEQQLREDLTRLVVHDLKNPLAAMVANLSALGPGNAGNGLDPRATRMLERAMDSARDMRGLLEDMIDYERLEGGALQPHLKPILLADVLRQRAESIQARADQFDQSLQLLIEDDFSEICLDRDLIERVVDNLLSNAVKFSGVGGSIRLAAYLKKGAVHIEVADDGPGIRPEERARIFNRYFRGSDAGRSGAGLGLSFCKMAVEAHGGHIWVDESSTSGAEFHVEIPLVVQGQSPAKADASLD